MTRSRIVEKTCWLGLTRYCDGECIVQNGCY